MKFVRSDGRGAGMLASIAVVGLLSISLSASGQQAGKGQELFKEAYELYMQEKYEPAAIKFNQGLKVEPNNPLAHYYLGQIWLKLDDTGEATKHFEASLKADSSSEVAPLARRALKEVAQAPNLEDTRQFIAKIVHACKYVYDDRYNYIIGSSTHGETLIVNTEPSSGSTVFTVELNQLAETSSGTGSLTLICGTGSCIQKQSSEGTSKLNNVTVECGSTAVVDRLQRAFVYLVKRNKSPF